MKTQIISTFKLAGSKDGLISLAKISEPYGEGSPDVISIASCLKEGQVDWKVHVPMSNLDELIIALKAIADASERA